VASSEPLEKSVRSPAPVLPRAAILTGTKLGLLDHWIDIRSFVHSAVSHVHQDERHYSADARENQS